MADVEDECVHQVFVLANMCALGLYTLKFIDALAERTEDIAVDATNGINNSGIQLFAVLVEVDGAGAPLAYLFVEKDTSPSSVFTRILTQILDEFLRHLYQTELDLVTGCAQGYRLGCLPGPASK